MDKIKKISQIFEGRGFALLDDNREEPGSLNYLFFDIVEWVYAYSTEELYEKLQLVDENVNKGFYAVGCYAYELGYALNQRLSSLFKKNERMPLFFVGIYRQKMELDDKDINAALTIATEDQQAGIFDCRLNMTKGEYLGKLEKVKKHILDGDTYQVNYTLKYKFKYNGSALKIYANLRKRQKVSYGAFLDFPYFSVLSRSPELFFKKTGETIFSKPMKGTIKRGASVEEDKQNFEFLSKDEKSRSENVMIVDLLRNDFSRICQKGSVKTTNLFEVQTFETLHQMISTISGKIDEGFPLFRLFKEIFPCGSITGAPKIRTMELINELEFEPRGIYTGAIGYIEPNKAMCFNVPIRTLVLWPDGNGEMGVGSGVVHDSDPDAEYDECLLKGQFFTKGLEDFNLIESLLFDGDYLFLEQHLHRLKGSADELGFRIDINAIREELLQKALSIGGSAKVRVVAFSGGLFNIEIIPLTLGVTAGDVNRITVVDEKVFSADPFLKHKTTKRALYNAVYERERQRGFYDAIFTNENGQITEGTFTNIFIRIGEIWYTPPVSCGLLPGIQRQALIDSNDVQVVEKPLFVSDMVKADAIYLTNSVRGIVNVTLDLSKRNVACSA